MSTKPEDIANKIIADFNKRVAKRDAWLARVTADKNDPMHQFQLRFIQKEVKKDDDNETYFAWYKMWKAGSVLDTQLRWAPSVYAEDGTVRPNFVDYVEIQMDLHKKQSLLTRSLFLSSIRARFPELTPTMDGLKQDIKGYRGETYEADVKAELKVELDKFGLPEALSNYLADKDVAPECLRKEAEFLKKCTEFGCHPEVAVCMLENKVEPDTIGAEVIRSMLLDHMLPDFVVRKVLKGELTPEEITEVADKAASLRENFGLAIFEEDASGNIMYDELLKNFINELTTNKRLRKVDAVCSKKLSVR